MPTTTSVVRPDVLAWLQSTFDLQVWRSSYDKSLGRWTLSWGLMDGDGSAQGDTTFAWDQDRGPTLEEALTLVAREYA